MSLRKAGLLDMVAVTLAIELLLMNLTGFLARKTKLVQKDFAAQLTSFLMKICLPCLIFRSVSSSTVFSLAALQESGIVILIAAAVMLLSFLVGQVAYLLARKSGFGRVLRFGLIFSHFSSMGIPVVQALFGDMGLFYYSFFLIPVRIAYYSFYEPLMTPVKSGSSGKKPGEIVKSSVTNPCLIAVAVGLVFWIAGWQLPVVLDYCVKSLSSIASPLSLLLCGMILGEYDVRKVLRVKYLVLPLLRTVAMPLLFLAVAALLRSLGIEEMICRMTVIFTALPVASLLPVYAVRYDPDPENHLNAAGACFSSVLLSMVTIPIFYTFLAG